MGLPSPGLAHKREIVLVTRTSQILLLCQPFSRCDISTLRSEDKFPSKRNRFLSTELHSQKGSWLFRKAGLFLSFNPIKWPKDFLPHHDWFKFPKLRLCVTEVGGHKRAEFSGFKPVMLQRKNVRGHLMK